MWNYLSLPICGAKSKNIYNKPFLKNEFHLHENERAWNPWPKEIQQELEELHCSISSYSGQYYVALGGGNHQKGKIIFNT